ncbi:MAG: hypothetical protein JO313_10240 [Verrucomicrobia bacterium]|nr:hypothetical protein [Verrucomicrobiota bacterium]
MPGKTGTAPGRKTAADNLSSLLLGAHMSIAGGPSKALERGRSIGCTAIQIFVKNNMQWFAKPVRYPREDRLPRGESASISNYRQLKASH